MRTNVLCGLHSISLVAVLISFCFAFSVYAVEGETDGFACPDNAVISQPGTVPGTGGYVPDYKLIEIDLLDAGQAALVLENFTLDEETTICSMTWWGVEVDAEGVDCITTNKEFTVTIVNNEGGFENPEYIQNIVMDKTAVGSASKNGKGVTIYRYHIGSLANCATLPAGEHYLSVVGLTSGLVGCSFGWMNTLSGDNTYFEVGEEGPSPTDGNLAFCLSLETPVEGEDEGEGEGQGEGEGEGEEGEVPVCSAESPYGPDDPCYVDVVTQDTVCCNVAWDNACQEKYNTCVGVVPHPADLNMDWSIKLPEAIAYLAGWQQGSNPIGYAIRAAYIWQNGEGYTYDAGQAPPNCWVLAE